MLRTLFRMLMVVATGIALAQPLLACDATDDTDYPSAVDRAKNSNRHLLLAFLGNDWSMTSLKLDREVFDQPAFADNAKYDFLLCKLHFYQTQERLPDIAEQNRALAERYKIDKFPTVVVLKPDGTEVGRLGYLEGGVEKFGAAVHALIRK